MSRSCFASFPVRVYKFSSHYLNNIIFIDNSLGPLAIESTCKRAALLTTEGHGDCNSYSGIITRNSGHDFMRQGCENFSKN
jgi:hypothetical protein